MKCKNCPNEVIPDMGDITVVGDYCSDKCLKAEASAPLHKEIIDLDDDGTVTLVVRNSRMHSVPYKDASKRCGEKALRHLRLANAWAELALEAEQTYGE